MKAETLERVDALYYASAKLACRAEDHRRYRDYSRARRAENASFRLRQRGFMMLFETLSQPEKHRWLDRLSARVDQNAA